MNKKDVANEAKRIEEDALYSSKTHFILGCFWANMFYWIGVPTALLAAAIGVSAFSDFDKNGVATGIISIFVAILAGLNTFLNPQEKAAIHKNAGNAYNSLRNKARIFYQIDLQDSQDGNSIRDTLEALNNERDRLNMESPHVYEWAFKKGRSGIEEGQAKYTVDCVEHKQ